MKRLKILGILAIIAGASLAVTAPAVAQHRGGGGGHFSGGGGGRSAGGGMHFGGGGMRSAGGGMHFGGGGMRSGGGVRFGAGARPGTGGLHFNGGARAGTGGLHFNAPRVGAGGQYYGRSAGVPRAGFSRPGIADNRSGLHFVPRGGYSGHAGYRGYGRPGYYGHGWRGGYWGGRYWPRAGFRSGFSWFLPVLPLGFSTYWWGGLPYYYYGDAYYTWNPYYNGYIATEPPPVADGGGTASSSEDVAEDATPPGADIPEIFAYPKNGQSEEQAAKDKDECQQWAVSETGFDAAHIPASGKGSVEDLQRAKAACLDARGYSTR